MKNIYLVRHGQTMANIEERLQGAEEVLSPQGEIQADKLGQRLSQLDIEAIYCSSMRRAVQTTEIICRHTNMTFQEIDVFCEERPPTSLVGAQSGQQAEGRVREHYNLLFEHAEDPNYHFEDEENLYERKQRAAEAFSFIQDMSEENVLIVSHGNFIKYIVVTVLTQGLVLTVHDFFTLTRQIKSANTGITVLRERNDHWQLLTWNDHAHFAE